MGQGQGRGKAASSEHSSGQQLCHHSCCPNHTSCQHARLSGHPVSCFHTHLLRPQPGLPLFIFQPLLKPAYSRTHTHGFLNAEIAWWATQEQRGRNRPGHILPHHHHCHAKPYRSQKEKPGTLILHLFKMSTFVIMNFYINVGFLKYCIKILLIFISEGFYVSFISL